MRIRVEVLSGARRGLRRDFDGPRVSVGRHPDCDLQLEPDVDRAASGRHAVLLLAGGRWMVRDMESRNGTFVGDERVEGERRLRDGDVVQFGREGPRVRVEMLTADTRPGEPAAAGGDSREGEADAGPDESSARPDGSSGDSAADREPARAEGPREGADDDAGEASAGATSAGPGRSTTDRLRVQVRRRGRALVAVGVVLAALAGAGAAYVYLGGPLGAEGGSSGPAAGPSGGAAGGGASVPAAAEQEGSGAPEATAAPDERTDSMLQATRQRLDSLRGRVSGLQEALRDSRQRVAGIQERLRRAESGSDGGASGASGEATSSRELRRRLDSAMAELQRQSAVAAADFSEVETRHWQALAQVYVQRSGGEVSSATAFAVRPEGLLITSRHSVLEGDGSPAPRIGVQFARSDQVWPAELVATHDEADLALIRVRNVQGDVPTVTDLGGTGTAADRGSPVAVLGYSGGAEVESVGEASGRLERPGLSAGLVVERAEDRLRVEGFGAEGGSGSPIFDVRGRLVGVLQGGIEEGGAQGRRILVAVPASIVRGLLSTVMERLGG